MPFRLFKLLPLFLITQNSAAQTIRAFHLDHRTNGSRIYASILSLGDDSGESLIRKLKAGDVGELKPVVELPAPGERSIGLNPGPGLDVRIETPGRSRIVPNASASRLELKTYSTDTMTKAPVMIDAEGHSVTVRPPEGPHLCAMSLVDEKLVSLLGTCTESTLFIAPGDQVRVYVEGVLQ